MDNCCDSLLKYVIFVCNFILFFTGALLIGMGTYIQVTTSDYLNFVDDRYMNVTFVFIAIGVVLLVVGFCGCCGAVTENSCMMFSFAFLLALIVLVEIGCAVTMYMYYDESHNLMEKKMIDGLQNYMNGEQYKGVTETWDAMQYDLSCCGVTNYTNWKNTSFSKDASVPDTCCKEVTKDCGKDVLTDSGKTDEIYQIGCLTRLEGSISNNGTYVLVFVLCQVLAVLLSCMLATNMRRQSNYV